MMLYIVCVVIAFLAAPSLFICPAILCYLVISEQIKQKNTMRQDSMLQEKVCDFRENNTKNYEYRGYSTCQDNMSHDSSNGICFEDDESYYFSYDNDDSYDESDERGFFDSILVSEDSESEETSVFINDSGLPTYWNDNGDIWGAPFGGI